MRFTYKYVAALVLALVVLFGSATVALAYKPADEDWWSWEDWYSGPYDRTLGYTVSRTTDGWYQEYYPAAWWWYRDTDWYWYEAGYYWWYLSDAYTWYDEGEMGSRGAGPTDWSILYRHEHAHQIGWDHGDGTPASNPAYYEYYTICGC